MHGRGIVRARLQAQWSLLLACAVLLLAGSTVLTGLVLHASATATAGVRDRLTALPASQRLVEVSIPSTSEDLVAEAEAAVLDDVDRAFGSRGYRPDVAASARSGLVPVTGPVGDSPEGPTRLIGVAYRDLRAHAELLDGAWPGAGATADGVPVALHTAAAARLGVGVGDTVPVELGNEPVTLVVTGTWRPRDSGDAYFAGEPLEVDGAEGPTTLGPFVPGDSAVLGRTTLRYRISPDLTSVHPAQLPGLRRAVARLELAARQDARLPAVTVSNPLERHLEELTRQSVAASSVAAVPVVVVAVVLASALLLTARLLVERRSGQTRLVRARGASAAQVAGWTAVEGVLLALPAAVLAAPLAWWVLRISGAGAWRPPSSGWQVALAAALGGAALLLLPSVLAARRWSVVTAPPGRRRDAGRAGAELALVAASVVAVWQLRRYGGTAVPLRTGVVAADPLLVAAPALAMLAGAAVAARLVPVLGSVAAAWAARRRGASTALAGWEVARRPATHAPAVMLLTLGIGAGLLATGYSASWQEHVDARAGATVGADLQVPLPDGEVAALQRIPGIAAVVPYSSEQSTLGSTATTLLAADAEAMQRLPSGEAASGLAEGGGGQLPVVVTRDVAENNSLSVGSLVSLRHEGRRLHARVVAVADALPAVTAPAVLVDLPSLSTVNAAVGEEPVVADRAWVVLNPTTRDDRQLRAATVDQIRRLSSAQEEVLDRTEISRALAGMQPAGGVPALLVTGAVAALVLTAAGLAVAGAATAHRRRIEQAVLRAVGASSTQLHRASAFETAGVGLLALVAGTAVGWFVAWLCVPALVAGVADATDAGGAATVDPGAALTPESAVVLAVAAGLAAAVGVARAAAVRRRPPASDVRLGVDP